MGRVRPAASVRLWFGDRVSEFACGFEPKVHRLVDVAQGRILGVAMSRAAWKLRHFGDKYAVFPAPVHDDFVLVHQAFASSWYLKTITSHLPNLVRLRVAPVAVQVYQFADALSPEDVMTSTYSLIKAQVQQQLPQVSETNVRIRASAQNPPQ